MYFKIIKLVFYLTNYSNGISTKASILQQDSLVIDMDTFYDLKFDTFIKVSTWMSHNVSQHFCKVGML